MIPDWFYLPLPMALLGAIPGSMRAYVASVKHGGRAKALADALIGVVFAASIADWLTPDGYPMVALVIGMMAALAGAKALDAFFELVPVLVRDVAQGWISRTFGRSDYGRYNYPPRLPPRDYRRELDNPDEVNDEHR